MFVHLLCNSYFDDLMKDFSNPKTASMLGIMNLHDEIMFYILIVFILKIFSIKSILRIEGEHDNS